MGQTDGRREEGTHTHSLMFPLSITIPIPILIFISIYSRLDAINIFDGSLTAINVEVKEGTELYRVNASKDPQNPDMILNNEFITDRAREVCIQGWGHGC